MKIEFEVPDGYHVAHAESSFAGNWLVWMKVSQRDGAGLMRGGRGRTLQEAIDNAMVTLREAKRVPRNPALAGITLNLGALHLNPETKDD